MSIPKPNTPIETRRQLAYDYQNQAWIENGRYVACSHPAAMNCRCYGKLHAGEIAALKGDQE